MNEMRWQVSKDTPQLALELAAHLGTSHLVGQMLVNRKIVTPGKAWEFMNPQLSQLHDPKEMPGAVKAAERIAKAIREKEQIVVWGDYDVDGVTGTTIMYHALTHFGAKVRPYIPHRLREGYGVNPAAVGKLIDEGCQLLVTVDCGITAVEPAGVCRFRGIDMIVTDHHDWKDELPQVYATVHPRLRREDGGVYPNPMLCGAGVAFKTAWQIGRAMCGEDRVPADFRDLMVELLSFAALGTIADVVPLQGENRVIAVNGLRKIPETKFHGLRALLVSAGLDSKDVDGYHVGFCLAPRLNAAGRMGHANTALKMFTECDYDEALAIARDLEVQNKQRQDTERAIVVEAKAQAEDFPGAAALVLVGKEWHSGVVGIVASRIIDEHYVPTMVLCDSDGDLHGSARSIEGFNLANGLKACEHLLTRWGGHGAAAGLKLDAKNLDAFRAAIDKYVRDNCPEELLKRRLSIDAWAHLSEVDISLCNELKRMGPYGISNRRPVLAIRDAMIMNPKAMGKEGKHLSFQVAQGNLRLKCVMWGQGEMAHKLPTDQWVDIAVEPQINEWQGRQSVELLCRGVRTK